MKPWTEYQSKHPLMSVAEFKEAYPSGTPDRTQLRLKQHAAYREDVDRLVAEFWFDARAELGYTDFLEPEGYHCIEETAWDIGHSGGFAEVFGVLSDLAAVARKIVKHGIKEKA